MDENSFIGRGIKSIISYLRKLTDGFDESNPQQIGGGYQRC